ncbi:hypothetical protein [Flavobacterium sp.]|uniref:hypothetical protein n=1 Tax=Flavobacterium sp. TaxID=239 RepID=UPI002488E516|nr:hypothetical protein [Flavobacterium sp.]MDI1315793.1 hypothetical protein [Flavobacterium sp.]
MCAKTIKTALLLLCCFLISCGSKTTTETEDNTANEDNVPTSFVTTETSECNFEDGTYPATVDYNNSQTGHSATYTLDVEVENCQIIQINFPNGGYVDEDHITAADIDENGNTSVEGEDGKRYEVRIDN